MKYSERLVVDHEDNVEKIAAIRKIRKLMEFWRISPSELRGRPIPVARPSADAEVRYRHPITLEVWDGQGSQPQWLRDALIKEGYTVDELRPAASQPAASASESAS